MYQKCTTFNLIFLNFVLDNENIGFDVGLFGSYLIDEENEVCDCHFF